MSIFKLLFEQFQMLHVFFMFEDLSSVSESCRRLTWRFGWGKLNGCADRATPVTGPEGSPPALGL